MTFPPMPRDTDLRLFVLPSVPASPLPDLLMTTLIRSLIFDNRGERSDWWHCVTAACLLAPAAPTCSARAPPGDPDTSYCLLADSRLLSAHSLGFTRLQSQVGSRLSGLDRSKKSQPSVIYERTTRISPHYSCKIFRCSTSVDTNLIGRHNLSN